MEPSILMNLTRSRILHMLATQGPATVGSISNTLSLKDAVVARELECLARAGFVLASNGNHEHHSSTYATDSPRIVIEIAQVSNFLGLEL